jgi:DNA mismatch endonuclease, patch repair protein
MPDIVKLAVRSRMMSNIRGKNTQPELVVRKGIFARGFRFRLHARSLPGCPDIVIRKYQAAIQVHGCFWHLHEGCTYFRMPDTNKQFWIDKLNRNRERDVRSIAALRAGGWRVGIIWECATRVSAPAVLDAICKFLQSQQGYIEISTVKTQKGLRVRSYRREALRK